MKFIYTLYTVLTLAVSVSFAQTKPDDKVSIMLMGSTHFGQQQFYKQGPSMDLFSNSRQQEIADINKQLAKYKPDLILIETEPSEQHTVDSIYHLFKAGKLAFNQLDYGRAEQYQFGYNLARQIGLQNIYGADYSTSVSTRLFKDGKNLDRFVADMNAYSEFGRSVDQQFKDGKLSLKNYLLKFNSPEIYKLTYQMIYVNPVKVTNGSFGKVGGNVIDTSKVDKEHIGADYVSLFYSRELKIYSNILTVVKAQQAKRVLLIMGQRHASALSYIMANDDDFKLVPLSSYLK